MDEEKRNTGWVAKVLSDPRTREFAALTAVNVSVASLKARRVFSYNCKSRRYTADPCELPPPNARAQKEGALVSALSLGAWVFYAPGEIRHIRRVITCNSPDGVECD